MTRACLIAILAVCFQAQLSCGGSQNGTTEKWNKGPMPAEGDFDGVYQSDFGRLEMTVASTGVTGLYENDQYNGRIQGEINKNLLEFTWTQWNQEMRGKVRKTTGKGIFQYVIEEVQTGTTVNKYHSLKGWWGYADGNLVNRWNAGKLSKRAKKKLEPWVPEPGVMDDGSGSTSSGFEDADAPAETGSDKSGEKETQKEKEGEDSIDDIF